MELIIFPIIIIPIKLVKLGVLSAKKENTVKDVIICLVAILGVGSPVFWILHMALPSILVTFVSSTN
jgi:ABC-type antimicrobial peptide transport system permease subunit